MKKLRFINYWLSCLLFLTGIAACNDDNVNEDRFNSPDISISPVVIRFNENQTATVTVSYPGKWQAELSDTTWCAINKVRGEGEDEITVSLKTGHASEAQTAKLTIRAADHPLLLKTVQLIRAGEAFYADPLILSYGLGDDKTQVVKVGCAGAWTAKLSDGCTWCEIDKESGTGSDEIRITSRLSQNPADVRDASLTVSSAENPEMSATVNITFQEKYLHGSCVTLQKASKGKGINLIITGDGFTDADMGKGGRWEDIMNRSHSAIFNYEPYTSFREYFNVYAVTAVSETDEILSDQRSNTFYGIYYEQGINPVSSINHHDFVWENTPIDTNNVDLGEVTALIVVNDDKYAGIASLSASSFSLGIACVWETSDNPIIKPENMFPTLIAHEFLGHAFGKLADEYYADGVRITEEDKAAILNAKEHWGWWQNVEFSDDPNQFKNTYWSQMLQMKYPDVGIIEGANYCGLGVWRSSGKAMMNEQVLCPFFSPVQREIIYRKIHELAGLKYSFDEFIEWDKKNLNK